MRVLVVILTVLTLALSGPLQAELLFGRYDMKEGIDHRSGLPIARALTEDSLPVYEIDCDDQGNCGDYGSAKQLSRYMPVVPKITIGPDWDCNWLCRDPNGRIVGASPWEGD